MSDWMSAVLKSDSVNCRLACVIQGWTFNSIVMEYRSFAGNKSRYAIEQVLFT
jgi:hypothetical protein